MPFEVYEKETEVDERPFDVGRFRRMLRYLIPYRRRVAAILIAILMSAAVTLFEPYLLGQVVDRGITPRNPTAITQIALLLLGLHLLGWIGNTLRINWMNHVGQSVLFDLRQELFNHIQKLSLRFYDQRPVGKIMSRITSDVNAIAELVNNGLVTIIGQGISIIGITIVMFWLSWQLSLLAFITMPILAIFFNKVRPHIETGWKNVQRTTSNISANTNESVNGIYVTQAFQREVPNFGTFQRLTQHSNDAWMRTIRIEEMVWPVVDIVGVGGTALVVVAGAWLALQGEVTLGLVLAFTGYLWRFWPPISSMRNSAVSASVRVMKPSARSVSERL